MRPIAEVTSPDTVVMFVVGDPTRSIPERSQRAFAARANRFDRGVPSSVVRKRAEIVQSQTRADHHDQHGT